MLMIGRRTSPGIAARGSACNGPARPGRSRARARAARPVPPARPSTPSTRAGDGTGCREPRPCPQIGVVGDHQRNLGIKLAGLPSPEQVDQAMPLLRDQDRHALGAIGEADPPVHAVLARQRGERGVELVPAQAEALALDLHPHEERAVGWIAHILVGAQDVPVVQGDEAGDRRDQTLVVGTIDQEPDVVAHRDLPAKPERLTHSNG